jgi:hypothetical protein
MYPRFTRIPDDDVQIFDGGLIALFGVRACNVDSAFSLSQIVAVQEVAFAALCVFRFAAGASRRSCRSRQWLAAGGDIMIEASSEVRGPTLTSILAPAAPAFPF